MAHQDLKFQVNPTLKDKWQPILGGQAHGTFFMIYAMFEDFEEHNQDQDSKNLFD